MKTVQVLLSTYNGDKYLREQLDSVLEQQGVSVLITVRDDGSTDSTLDILEEYKQKGKLEYYSGTNIGYRKSFLNLAYTCKGTADYYAFCDQDDVWKVNKLREAVKKLEKSTGRYKLYFSDLIVTDELLNKIDYKNYNRLNITLGSAMVRHNISGCTMVFNDELLEIAVKKELLNYEIGSHDAWLYKVCLSIGGTVIYDNNSYIYYRQHNHNVTGVKQGILKRVSNEIKGFTRNKNLIYKVAQVLYNEYASLMPNKNKRLLEDIVKYRTSIIATIKLIRNKDLRFGINLIDFRNKIMILLRNY